jgi:two-component system, sensor histidine kinase PdtaS
MESVQERDELHRQLARTKARLLERERELRELNHRISNSLQLISSFLSMQMRQSGDEVVRQTLEMATSRIAAVGRLHRHLNQHRAVRCVNFGKLLYDLSSDISGSTGMECEVVSESILVAGEKACKLVILINELMMNAYKHGYDRQEGGKIKVECQPHGSSHMRATVSDHGKGLPAGFDPQRTHGLGLSVVSSIVSELGGELRIRNCPGAAFDIIVPAP